MSTRINVIIFLFLAILIISGAHLIMSQTDCKIFLDSDANPAIRKGCPVPPGYKRRTDNKKGFI